MGQKIREFVTQMALEENVGMCSGFDFWIKMNQRTVPRHTPQAHPS